MRLLASEAPNTPFLHEKRTSANLGVYKLTRLEIPCEMKEKAFKTFRQAFEGVLKGFAMQFEAQCLAIPWEMKGKAFRTFPQAFEGVLKEFAMQFEAQCLEIPCEMREKSL